MTRSSPARELSASRPPLSILVVEDEQALRDLVADGLGDFGHDVTTCGNGWEALDRAGREAFDVIVLDVGLPELDGFSVARRIRERGDQTAILMLTARAETRDVVEGLESGADDYLAKPFDFRELNARITALSRRSGGGTVLRRGPISLDLVTQTVSHDGATVSLTGTEFRLLATLMRSAGEALDRPTLRRQVWGMDFDPGTRLVDVHVANLRRKLKEPGVIETVRGVGFRFAIPQA